ncbi:MULTISPECIES: (d)CMP kinase [unclassified Methanoculleus]|uniref:(d)CMP kinase n=1 Tax=unclassified Methanoculleus TaxID=2619537 RepID=UPI0025D9861B|nr:MULTISPECIES: AAA family ATPase [unclassified Methanoculleus]MCK9318411.1 AAA family ATPase [Methanoculleus sp.]MDD2254152.1 AAA family ATPase [Methanoculleus sp.]MDD2788516.1 AAA family ATPase [Methanoculleus sp.]MDD3216650.1 AAA family ATPase [Methanoculleus sp.]MDD4314725.1 AAA family ATPase [Methanoculleus sp.]
MRITISGPPGSGTTSLARSLAGKYGLDLISAGEVFRQLAREHGMDLAEFGRFAENDPSVDRMIDARQKEIGEGADNIIIEGRLSGRMIENADLRIWLSASLSCRAKRIAGRDGMDEAGARVYTENRQRSEATRYRNYYGIEIDDLSSYDIVLSSETFGVGALGTIVDTAIGCLARQKQPETL